MFFESRPPLDVIVIRRRSGTYLSFIVISSVVCGGQDEMEVYKQQMGGQVDTGCYIGAYLHELDQLKPGEGDDTTLSSKSNSFT